jgi:nitroreductase
MTTDRSLRGCVTFSLTSKVPPYYSRTAQKHVSIHNSWRIFMHYDEFLQLVRSRRSIRRLKPDPISNEIIDQIIEAARWAPSGFNTQPWEFIVVRKQTLKYRIAEICEASRSLNAEMEATRRPLRVNARLVKSASRKDNNDIAKTPVFILLCGDRRTSEGLPMARRCDPCRTESVLTSGLASAFLYMHLAATNLGLGSRWVSSASTPYGNCMIKHLLGLPEPLDIYDMMVLGYPAVTPRPKFIREVRTMVHYDDCGEGDFRTDEEVREFLNKTRNWNIAAERRKVDP